MAHHSPEFKAAVIEAVRAKPGLTRAQIGQHFGLTKGGVIGILNRSGWEGRRQLIPKTPYQYREHAKKAGETRSKRIAERKAVEAERAPVRTVETPRPVVVPLPRPTPSPIIYGRVTACCWPIGEPRTKGFRMCDEPSKPGGVYCLTHHARAVKPLRREDVPDAAD